MMQPEKLGDDETSKEPLNPPEIMIGCHKTAENPEKRNFSSGTFDEIAIWRYWLNNTLLPFFLGGYSKSIL